ncbi:rhodopsin, GQ-coupled-like [Ruditapes philippinarum]|uniref:rhodopsin, GQ-coupled-like n=1 Tax=Ruditapes philippinarum TaxID=129788 RepID=UPI00295B2E01|nr:rhodopsin, GQ-coupled-like [Ruditapes philippinarum]
MNITIVTGLTNETEALEVLEDIPHLSYSARIIIAITMILTLVFGTIGNSIVLALFVKYKSLRTSSNIFICSLTVADLLMCLGGLPTLISTYVSQEIRTELLQLFCHYDTFIGAFTGFGAIWSLMVLAIDRCVVISRSMPVQRPSDKIAAYYITAIIWIVSFAIALMPFIGFGHYVIEGSKIECSVKQFTRSLQNISYNILIQLLYFCLPIVTMIFCYGTIFIKVRNHERRYFDARSRANVDDTSFRRMRKNRKLERNEMKTAKAGLILISVFCLSWTPYSIVSWIGLFGDRSTITPLIVALPAVFAKVSTIMNPLLYALLLRSFKLKLSLFYQQHFKSARASNVSSVRTHMDYLSQLDRQKFIEQIGKQENV